MKYNSHLFFTEDQFKCLAKLIEQADPLLSRREHIDDNFKFIADNNLLLTNFHDAKKFFTYGKRDFFYYLCATYLVSQEYWDTCCQAVEGYKERMYTRFAMLTKFAKPYKILHGIAHLYCRSSMHVIEDLTAFTYLLPHDLDKFINLVDVTTTHYKYNDHKVFAEHHYDKDANDTFGTANIPVGYYYRIVEEHDVDIIQTTLQKMKPGEKVTSSHFHPQLSSFYVNVQHDRFNYYLLRSKGWTDNEIARTCYGDPRLANLPLLPVEFKNVIHYPDYDEKDDFGVPFFGSIVNGELVVDDELRHLCRTSTNHMKYIIRNLTTMAHLQAQGRVDDYNALQDAMFKHFDHEKLYVDDYHLLQMELDAIISCDGISNDLYDQVDHLSALLTEIKKL